MPMPHQRRIEYTGAIYHIMNRGDRQQPIFQDDADRTRFLQTFGETRQPARSEPVSKVRSDPFTIHDFL